MQQLDTIILLLGILCLNVLINMGTFLVMSFTLINICKRIEKRDEIVDDEEFKEITITGFKEKKNEKL